MKDQDTLAEVKVGLAEMLKGGVIMDVTTPEEARIAEEAGAVAVMVLDKIPADVLATGGVARTADTAVIEAVQEAVSVPVMAKCRIGHFAEAQMLQAMEVDYIDESEVLTPADHANHIDKHAFRAPFLSGCKDLGQALRRIAEGASLIRSKGAFGTGNIASAVSHLRLVTSQIQRLFTLPKEEIYAEAKRLEAPLALVEHVAETGALPVPLFAAGGVATPADAALLMQLGAESVFVGSGIFKSSDPVRMANAIVQATTHYQDPKTIAEISKGLKEPMSGVCLSSEAAEKLLSSHLS